MKELKNKVDSIRRTLKAKGIAEVTAAQIEAKILDLCPDFPDDWCSDIRSEVINSLIKDLQPSELATAPAKDSGNTHTEKVSKLEQSEETANITSEATALDCEKDLEAIVHEANELQLKPSIEQSEMPAIASEDEPEETAIALQEKSELVASTANDMGITLSIEEVTAIAENFDYASVNSDYEIAEIESAITAFVQHKAQVTKQKITNMVQGVKETVTRLDNENSQLLNDGLREINNDIKRGSQKFKSSVRTALKAFALPPSKTG
ncbi:hypothetical protein IQ243_24145 [Nostocales cyanobacterium LEGE 11386]|nr:hypothetical protein [Nostocales cyanobacterium LEGE 11386]